MTEVTQKPLRHLIITGTSGYIGRRLVQIARAQGFGVTALGRRTEALQWTLGDGLPAAALASGIPPELHALIHLAHDWTTASDGNVVDLDRNVTGTLSLLQDCRARGIGRFVFVSSQSARVDAANHYGKIKWRIEQELQNVAEIAVRVGLVYGGFPRGLFQIISRLIRYAPLLPMITPEAPVQPIHVDEVARGLILAARSYENGWIGLASPVPITFKEFLRAVAVEQYGKRLRILPIPLRLALTGIAVARVLPFLPRIDRGRVLGLAGSRPLECDGHAERLGLDLVPLAAALQRDPSGRKAALREARVLLRYVIGSQPGNTLVRRYVRALSKLNEGGRLLLPIAARWWPGVLRWFEPLDQTRTLARRLDLATALAVASPEGAHALDMLGKTAFGRCARLIGVLTIEAIALPVRLMLGRMRP